MVSTEDSEYTLKHVDSFLEINIGFQCLFLTNPSSLFQSFPSFSCHAIYENCKFSKNENCKVSWCKQMSLSTLEVNSPGIPSLPRPPRAHSGHTSHSEQWMRHAGVLWCMGEDALPCVTSQTLPSSNSTLFGKMIFTASSHHLNIPVSQVVKVL